MNTKKQKLILENWKKFLRETEQETGQNPELEDEDTFENPEEKEQFQQDIIKNTDTDTPDNEEAYFLDPSLSDEDVAGIILAAIKKHLANSGVELPEDAEYLKGATSLILTNFGPRAQRAKVLSKLDQKDFFADLDMPKFKGITKYKKKKKKIVITLAQGKKNTVLEKGEKAEEIAAQMINSFFVKNNLEGKDQEGKFFAEAQGGSSIAKDVVIKSKNKNLVGIEVKTTAGTRTDFGQFRIRYEEKGNWALSKVSETGKYAKEKAEMNIDNSKLFGVIEKELNNIQPVSGQPPFPTGPRLKDADARQFWLSYSGEPRQKSLSGDVQAFEIPKEAIREKYQAKGNSYILIGGDLFSLSAPGDDPYGVPSIDDKLEKAYILFRIKYHAGDDLSYTCAIRTIPNKLSAPLDEQLEKIFLSEQS